MTDLSNKVLEWASEKDINNPSMQLVKTMEEFGELCDAISKIVYSGHYTTDEDKAKIEDDLKDAIGDTLVTLIIESDLLGVSCNGLTFTTPIKIGEDYVNSVEKLQISIMRDLGSIAKQIAHDKRELIELDVNINNAIFAVRSIAFAFNFDAKDCLELAYNEIKNRSGKTVDGNFIKEQ